MQAIFLAERECWVEVQRRAGELAPRPAHVNDKTAVFEEHCFCRCVKSKSALELERATPSSDQTNHLSTAVPACGEQETLDLGVVSLHKRFVWPANAPAKLRAFQGQYQKSKSR